MMEREMRNTKRKELIPKPALEFAATEGMGLLEFLLHSLPNRSRNHVKSLLTHRLVSVDGVVTTQYDTVLNKGQIIRINRPAAFVQTQENVPDILYEDDDLIAIDKPAGLLSIASDTEKELTAYYQLTDYVKLQNPQNRIFTVHRLDRETSGVLIVAKNERMKSALQDNWADLVSDRAYLAVVEGRLEEKSGRIQSWLKETKTLLMYSSPKAGEGLEAITRYQVLNESPEYSLLDIHLETGRKNQIRVHMKELGHSVAGDKKYGAKTNPLKRLGLHAYRLEFKHPFSGEVMRFEAPAPPGFTALFKKPKQNKK